MASKYTDFFDSSRSTKPKREGKLETPEFESPKFEDRYALPEDIKRKEDIKKEFKNYLTHKEESFNRGYVAPPFEASKVPSPYHGFKKPKARGKKVIDYSKLKNDMAKQPSDFIILETFSTPELETIWTHQSESCKPQPDKKLKSSSKSFKRPTREKASRSHGLHRTLESIMDEEQSGNNNSKRNVPGYFNNK
ncbi:MAG: hypothetical protein JJU01_00645 [Alkalibacterium sp.]|nr:hypothetical protein [Alkalibacterium sp.]TVP92332.1 MAG: hypothetical protein EA249_02085 [Alkalibacterium sp.]